jgi:hypothetical protein
MTCEYFGDAAWVGLPTLRRKKFRMTCVGFLMKSKQYLQLEYAVERVNENVLNTTTSKKSEQISLSILLHFFGLCAHTNP